VKRRVLRLGVITFAGAVALASTGAVYESVASARDRRDPPGRIVDIGGRRLHVLCIGSGRPTVVFEPSGRGRSVSLEAARTSIARHTRVCSYDRAGTGWSDDGPAALSVGGLADDLRRLLEVTPIETPVVIVASSMGGAVAEMYARRFPERVAGLVLLDAANSQGITLLNAAVDRRTRMELETACFGIRVARPIGVVRLLDSRPRTLAMLCAAVRGVPETLSQFESAPPLRADVPLAVFSADSTDDILPVGRLVPASLLQSASVQRVVRNWRETHRRFAAQSTRGSWRLVSGSGHVIAEDRPDVVAEAVVGVLRQLRQ
jgi:pimeloyl-ACP methyl ester carboxylesterase